MTVVELIALLGGVADPRKNRFEFVDVKQSGKWIGEKEPLPRYSA